MLMCTIALNVEAQTQPPNADFEIWGPIGLAENPLGWSSFNDFYSFGIPELSFKTTDAHSGAYALRLISDTATLPPPFGTNNLDTMAGFVFVGGTDMNNPGIPYSDSPVFLQAFVKGTIVSGSQAYIMATLSKWNTTTLVRDQVAFAIYYTGTSIVNYLQIVAPFTYNLSVIPDTLDIKIMAGDVGSTNSILPGNEFFVDDINLSYITGVGEVDAMSFSVFPNPATNKITVSSLEKLNKIEVYNLLGEIVNSVSNFNSQNSCEINLSNLRRGIYFVKAYGDNYSGTRKIILL